MDIKISDGNVIQVDEDTYYNFILGNEWYIDPRGYVHCNKLGQLHRLIMETNNISQIVDHKDRNKKNNLKSNLRYADKSTNGMNREKQANNTSGYKGVTFDKERGHWKAQIKYKGNHMIIGRFDSARDAALAYDSKAREYFGEFAVLNFPNINKKVTGKRRLSSLSTTGYKGVSFIKRTGKYSSRCRISKYYKYIGSFDTAKEAAEAYDRYILSIGKPEYCNGGLLA